MTATWADAQGAVLAIASALVESDVKTGDHVVILSENRLEWIYCDLAIQSVGAVTVPIYAGNPSETVQVIVANCDAVLAIAADDKMAGKLTNVRTVRMDSEVAEWLHRSPSMVDEVVARLEKITPDDVCTIVYTSGTTGDPKGAVLAHRNFVDTTRSALKVFPLSREDFTLSWLPLSHVFERINGLCSVVTFGGQMWLSHGIERLTEDIGNVRPTMLLSAPRVYEKMHAAVYRRVHEASLVRRALFRWAIHVGTKFSHTSSPGPLLKAEHRFAERLVLGPLRVRLTGGRLRFFISGSAALARNVEEFFWAIGVPILNGWGMTETSAGATTNTLTEHRFLTVGKPLPGVELKLSDDGEILVKSPGNMLGYHKNPTATAEILKDGWIYTGDIGEIDNDGFLKITDRKKSLFKTAGGKYIAPQQLEFALMHDPLVERAVIIGEGRPYVTALIVPDREAAKAQALNETALTERIQRAIDAANAKLGSWETIKYFTLLPRDFTEESGELSLKLDVKRKVVAQRYQKEIEAMYTGKTKPA